mmetsp:Transcript_19917/g.29845  ORF Transcript_19917/g.29845 Transcript_19917/m.29845 type:complete len:86 (+) Transcript_19917:277-534(+)
MRHTSPEGRIRHGTGDDKTECQFRILWQYLTGFVCISTTWDGCVQTTRGYDIGQGSEGSSTVSAGDHGKVRAAIGGGGGKGSEEV